MAFVNVNLIPPGSLMATVAILLLGLSRGLVVDAASSLSSTDQQHQVAFHTYDLNHDGHLDNDEFTRFCVTLFKSDEQRYLSPYTTKKLFMLLDMDGDNRLNSEEFRKMFQRWYLPILDTKSCLFLCVPHDAANETDLENKATRLIEQSQDLFKVHYVYVAPCGAESTFEDPAYMVEHVQKALPKAYDIKVYSVDSHLESLKNKNFDQFIVHFANVKHDRTFLRQLMSHNSAKQLPTAIIANQDDRKLLGGYLDDEHLHSSIIVNPSLNSKERARYKSDLAMILARKIFRKYKKLLH